jgi:hypothetical protein
MDKYPSWTSGRHHAKCDDSAGLPYSDSDLDIVKITCPDVRFDSTTWWNKQFVDHCPWSAKQFDWYLTQLVPNWDLLAAKLWPMRILTLLGSIFPLSSAS